MLYDLWERYRTFIVILGISLFLTISFILYPGATEIGPSAPFQTAVYASESEKTAEPLSLTPSRQAEDKQVVRKQSDPFAQKQQYVDLKGAVKKPGLYSFADNERVNDILQRAGGLLPNADLNRVNLAQTLVDGMIVWIPAQSDKAVFPLPLNQTDSETAATDRRAASVVPAAETKVNINQANLEQLMTLPGIGETRAKAILSYREKQGGFRSIDQLQEVGGIGEKLYEKIKEKISLQ